MLNFALTKAQLSLQDWVGLVVIKCCLKLFCLLSVLNNRHPGGAKTICYHQNHRKSETSQKMSGSSQSARHEKNDKLASAEFVESDIKINTTSGRVVLKKHYASQPSQFHSFRLDHCIIKLLSYKP